MQPVYEPQQIEATIQAYWQDTQAFKATEDPDREKFYCLSMFPYPSGRLHMGHVRNYTIGDVIARYQRMLGKNVLQPMGWDAFGLPAENAALKHGKAPAAWTQANIADMKRQLNRLGFAYDWDRELATCQPDYYRWEQWLFTRLVEKGLAYRKNATVNWDPVDQTVLANEQVIDGKGWRSGADVEKRDIAQWFLKITDYAPELLEGLDKLPGWPEQVRTMQRNWIGRSEGVWMQFALPNQDTCLEIYTTRADTVMGVTYLAVAAEHPLALQAAEQHPAIATFIESCQQGGVSEAELENREKRGCPLGVMAIHPISGAEVPVYAANFVLMSYGTGAVMAVPAHDQRDWEFAEQYGIPKCQVIAPADAGQIADISQAAYTEQGVLKNSGPFDGQTSAEARTAIAAWLAERGTGGTRVNYRLRDWGISRQRYWGCPIPMEHQADGSLTAATELPVTLPEDVEIDGTGSPLKKMPSFYALDHGVQRETDTFDTFIESSWYYARYCCPDADQAMLDERAHYWLPVDQYVGGIEHAILHLLYARFFNKLMRDEGLVKCDEPFTRLLTQGMVIAETYYRQHEDGSKTWYNPAEIQVEQDQQGKVSKAWLVADGQPVIAGGVEKMSKSKNNGIDPQTLIEQYGADTVRLYTMFTAPPEQSLTWSDEGVEGVYRYLKRLWALAHTMSTVQVKVVDLTSVAQVRYELHTQLQKALYDYERQRYNTVVSACMSMTNVLHKMHADSPAAQAVQHEGMSLILRLLAPIAPHITQHLWETLDYGTNIVQAGWPTVDEAALQQETEQLVVQVNGKVRAHIMVSATAEQATIQHTAQQHANVQRFIAGKTVRKVIVVPGRLVNIVAT